MKKKALLEEITRLIERVVVRGMAKVTVKELMIIISLTRRTKSSRVSSVIKKWKTRLCRKGWPACWPKRPRPLAPAADGKLWDKLLSRGKLISLIW